MGEGLSIWDVRSSDSPVGTAAQTHCGINITADGGANEGEQCPTNLCPSFDDPLVSPPSDFHVAFEGWSVRSLLFSSSSLFHLTLPLLHFSCLSTPCASSIPCTCSIFQSHASFFQHGLHPFKTSTCAISFLFGSCSWGFFCP